MPPVTPLSSRGYRNQHDPSVPAAISQCAVMSHPLSARPANGTSTESAVATPEIKRSFEDSSVCSVPEVLLHYKLR